MAEVKPGDWFVDDLRGRLIFVESLYFRSGLQERVKTLYLTLSGDRREPAMWMGPLEWVTNRLKPPPHSDACLLGWRPLTRDQGEALWHTRTELPLPVPQGYDPATWRPASSEK